MFEQMFMPWLLFLVALYMVFVLAFTDVNGTFRILLWKVVPILLLLASGLAWLMEMGFVLAPQGL